MHFVAFCRLCISSAVISSVSSIMKRSKLVLLLLCVTYVGLCGFAPTAAFRVLGLFPSPSQSHNSYCRTLMEALAERGHQVTMVSPIPSRISKPNVTDVDLSASVKLYTNSIAYESIDSSKTTIPDFLRIISKFAGNQLCRDVFKSQQFQDVMRGKFGEFDVVFTTIFGSDCFAAVAYIMKVPLISMVPSPDMPWMHERMGSIDNPSYIGNVFTGLTGRMNFQQRAYNLYGYIASNYMHKTHMQDGSDEVVREFFGPGIPPLSDIIRNTSLVLVNRHVSIHEARPVAPNVVHVGGLHYSRQGGDRLDPELRRWMDEAEHGVIVFSLGSMVLSSTLPREARSTLLAAFASVPQRVVWKYEQELLDELPPNVRIGRWLPQQQLLAHPKTVLFITHGGLMGTTEALMSGVPMLGMPLFSDQIANIKLYRSLGLAEQLDHHNLEKNAVVSLIKTMTAENNRYMRRAREVLALYLDRPMTPREEAVWWVEYVVRHRGAPHLRPLGADMPLHQYLLLDVVAAAVALAALVALALCFAIREVVAACSAGAKCKSD